MSRRAKDVAKSVVATGDERSMSRRARVRARRDCGRATRSARTETGWVCQPRKSDQSDRPRVLGFEAHSLALSVCLNISVVVNVETILVSSGGGWWWLYVKANRKRLN